MNKTQSQKQNSLTRVWWIFLSLNLLISCTAIVLNFAGNKGRDIVYVDAIKLISKYKGMEEARKQLQIRSQSWKANLDSLKQEMESASAKYESNKKRVSAKEELLMKELVLAKQKQYFSYEDAIKNKYLSDDKEKSAQILNTVNEYVKKYGESHKYTIILAATNYGNIAYADKSLDITDEVLVGLNQQFDKVK